MNPANDILDTLATHKAAGQPFVLATVVHQL